MQSEQAQSPAGAPGIDGALEWRCVGPHRGGRVVAVAGHPTERNTFYFGACAGGVWKTSDAGLYWENISDGFFGTAAIGALAVSPSDPNVIYAGTGEATIRGNVSHGDGVYKSTDGGKTWSNVGLRDTRHIGKIRVHPHNPDVVYVAALGHAFGPNEERGLFRSTDGGKTWEKILYRDENTGAIDLSMDPNNPRILYCSLWQVRRYPWALESGGPGSGLFKSTDGGDTWKEITRNEGLPKGVIGKIGVAVSPSRPERVWALVEAKDGALFRSDDAGDTWQRVSDDDRLRWRAWYYMHVFADPQNADTVWVLDLFCLKSIDGGKTFHQVPTHHGDNHDLWIDPHDSNRMIIGDDGGASVTLNGATSWSTIWNQPTAQFYHVITDNEFPYRLYGSQQDNSALSVPSWSINGAITETEWFVPGGGESGYIAIKPDDPNIIFGGAIGSGLGNGYMTRFDRRTGQEQDVNPWPNVTGMAEGASSLKYRFQWTFPIQFSPHDPNTLYVTANVLLRSRDEGMSWEQISPDLTRDDKSKQQPSGGPITKDNTGAEVYDTIFAFVESPHQPGLFWAGTDDGLVHISRDGGQNWENVTPADLPEWALISIIEVSPHNPAGAYIAATRYKLDDPTPYLYKTSDYGKTWQRITNGIPAGDFTRVIRADPEQEGLLYAGTETGVYVSYDDGSNWEGMQGNLPVAPIHDLEVKGAELIAATHGRSFWILNDLAPIRQIAQQRELGDVRLFQPAKSWRRISYGMFYSNEPSQYVDYAWAGPVGVAYRNRIKPNGQNERNYLDAGKNPPDGVLVTYYLKEKPAGEISLTFLDEAGNEIRTFKSKEEKQTPELDERRATAESPQAGPEGMEAALPEGLPEETKPEEAQRKPTIPKEAGINRFVWNMRLPDAHKVPDDKNTEEFLMGPAVLPGTYGVRLTVDGQSQTQQFQIVQDPRTNDPAALQAQFDLLKQIRDKLSETHDAINGINAMIGQLDEWNKRFKDQEDKAQLVQLATDARKALLAVRDELWQSRSESALQFPIKLNGKLASLTFVAFGSDRRPPKQVYEVFEMLSGQIDQQLQRLKEVEGKELAAFNQALHQQQIPVVAAPPVTEE